MSDEETCLACGQPVDYCQGGHGEPCEFCRGWLVTEEGEGADAHELGCVLDFPDNEERLETIEAHGYVVEPVGQWNFQPRFYGNGKDGLEAIDYQARIYLAFPGESSGQAVERITDEPDPYPDYQTNGHGGWSIC